jgi:hypothetical protein
MMTEFEYVIAIRDIYGDADLDESPELIVPKGTKGQIYLVHARSECDYLVLFANGCNTAVYANEIEKYE